MSHKRRKRNKRRPKVYYQKIWWEIELYHPIKKKWWHLWKTKKGFEVLASTYDQAIRVFHSKWPNGKVLTVAPKGL